MLAIEADWVCASSASSQLVKAVEAVFTIPFGVAGFPHFWRARVAIMDSFFKKVVVYLGEAVLAIDTCRNGVSLML